MIYFSKTEARNFYMTVLKSTIIYAVYLKGFWYIYTFSLHLFLMRLLDLFTLKNMVG